MQRHPSGAAAFFFCTSQKLLAAGMDADTVELALTFQLPLNR